jgi:uncharacterized protein
MGAVKQYHPALMSPSLPDRIDPWHFCAKGKTLQGRLALRELKRLVPLLASPEGEAAFTLEFLEDADGRAVVHGEIRADAQVVCQRCLEAMTWRVVQAVDLALARSIDEVDRLPEHLDPLLVQVELLDPREILEDELILALPTAPRHSQAHCAARPGEADAVSARRDEDAKRESPFAVLSTLKRDDKQGET